MSIQGSRSPAVAETASTSLSLPADDASPSAAVPQGGLHANLTRNVERNGSEITAAVSAKTPIWDRQTASSARRTEQHLSSFGWFLKDGHDARTKDRTEQEYRKEAGLSDQTTTSLLRSELTSVQRQFGAQKLQERQVGKGRNE
mgnify:CR=1 FL=1